MRIAIACDHIAFEAKEKLKAWLEARGYDVLDCGCHSRERTHYPLYGRAAGLAVASGKAEMGIVMCGTGVGISNAANKVAGVRCVLCHDGLMAQRARKIYNANLLAMGSRVIGEGVREEITERFLKTEFDDSMNNQLRQELLDLMGSQDARPGEELFADLLAKWQAGEYHD